MQIIILSLGFFLLVKGAKIFVEGASATANRFGVSQLVIGLTVVAMGTSIPEAAVSITAALNGNAEIAIGNVIGSNILNVLLILGISALIANLAVQPSTLRYEMPLMIGVTVLLAVLSFGGMSIRKAEGCILLGVFALYLLYLIWMSRGDKPADIVTDEPEPALACFVMVFSGICMVIIGSSLVVDSASSIATGLGMSDSFIGLTVVALGTSLPELVTSVAAARRGNADIAIGNIVGSNIFNILFILGISSMISPLPMDGNFIIDMLIAVAAGVLLLLACLKSRELRKNWGIVMLLGYAAYFAYLCIK